ncbi:50S ribosomal protein L11 methyltransferase [bacterium]|nr:50S ribosomal protein L11 methyltransferase [bacterium]
MEFPVSLTTSSGLLHFAIDSTDAFGSGLHESTASCLRHMAHLSDQGKKGQFLDLGCGSGILSIAALKLGFSRVIAFDVRSQACETARLNFIRHEYLERTVLFCGTIASLRNIEVDLLVANIQGDILLDLHTVLPGYIKDKGILIAAGIAWDWLYDVKTALAHQGLSLIVTEQLEEFSTLIFQR